MIEAIDVYITFQGENFSPKEAERLTGLALNDKRERGDIGTRGRYAGKPVPYGSGVFKPPSEINTHDKLIWLASALSGKLEKMTECGADDSHYIMVTYFFKDQANFSLSKAEVSAISALGVDFEFSCCEVD